MFKPFVLGEAKRFATSGVSRDDLIQEGLIAVALAWRSWRPDGGSGFLSWIRQPVQYAMLRVVRDHRRRGGSFRGGKRGGVRPDAVRLVSFDAEPSTAEATSLELFRRSPSEVKTMHDVVGGFEEPADCLARARLPLALALLDARERDVIRLRFEKKLTRKQVGARLQINRETVRQVEVRALKRLRELMTAEEPQA